MSSYIRNYIKWVEEHPNEATDLENGLKWLSYAVTASVRKTKNSLIINELVYKSGKLLTFLNDRVFERASRVFSAVQYSRIEYFLGFLESSEVIFELAGTLGAGKYGKWSIIIAIQIVKTICRLILLYQKRRMLTSPAVGPVFRDIKGAQKPDEVKTLPSSGRRIRSLDSVPIPPRQRSWEVPSDPVPSVQLSTSQLLGELFYVSEPMVHLGVLKLFGEKSWTPWAMSLACELISHALHGDPKELPECERSELSRRRIGLFLYLLRSPLYDSMTKKIVFLAIYLLETKVPFLGNKMAELLMVYIPHYRNIYSYLWSK